MMLVSGIAMNHCRYNPQNPSKAQISDEVVEISCKRCSSATVWNAWSAWAMMRKPIATIYILTKAPRTLE
jgi:hypothetical protein